MKPLKALVGLALVACSGGTKLDPDLICPTPPTLRSVPSTATVVGTGTAGSCTEAALTAALAAPTAMAITFNCGPSAATIALTTALTIDHDVTIDGGGLVTLDGQGATRIVRLTKAATVDLQRLTFANAKVTDGPGAAIYNEAGATLQLVETTFISNTAIDAHSDWGGGALYSHGGTVTIVDASFHSNRGANGGAIGILRANLNVFGSEFDNNEATGDASDSSPGGAGGAIYVDGLKEKDATPLVLCNNVFRLGSAAKFGGALFGFFYKGNSSQIIENAFTSNSLRVAGGRGGAVYHQAAPTTIARSAFVGNTSTGGGGALALHTDSFDSLVVNSTFADNSAQSLGGAVSVESSGGIGALAQRHDRRQRGRRRR